VFGQLFAMIAAVFLAKVAFLIAYAPVYPRFGWKLQVLFMASIIVSVVSFLAAVTVYFFWCTPVFQNWSAQDTYPFPTGRRAD
jgi:hypothetical protein